MTKDIVFCADGTWNGMDVDKDNDGVPDITNVLKLFHLLQGETTLASRRLNDENEKVLGDAMQPQLVAKYLHGVGDTNNPIKKVVGGAFGSGLIARIVRGYTFISRNYQPGDRITIVGFSRGAYTARALAGMISSVGLLDPEELGEDGKVEDEEQKKRAYGMGVSAWLLYRDKAKANQKDLTLRHKLAELVSNVPLFAKTSPLPPTMVAAPIHTVAVWDTVGALGIPNLGKTAAAADAYRFADDLLSSNVAHGLHAVSFDEKRPSFAPTLWQKDDARIQQYWFSGAHADVGGGYPARESGLSNIALKWMVEELEKLGLPFKPFPEDWTLDPHQDNHEPWKEGIFSAVPPADRVWDGFFLVEHPSFIVRRTWIAAGRPELALEEDRALA